MKQITEDYCSFETAKLLKEKGFDGICSYEWGVPDIDKGYVLQKWVIDNGQIRNSDLIDGAYTAPTHQMALKWLREVHNVLIHVNEYGYPDKEKGRQYTFVANIRNMKSHIDITQFLNDSYEEACEAALKFTLENLI